MAHFSFDYSDLCVFDYPLHEHRVDSKTTSRETTLNILGRFKNACQAFSQIIPLTKSLLCLINDEKETVIETFSIFRSRFEDFGRVEQSNQFGYIVQLKFEKVLLKFLRLLCNFEKIT